MAIWGAAVLALTAVQAISSIKQGYDQKEESRYNADLLQGKAELVDVQKGIEFTQYERLKQKTWGTSMANTAAMGIQASGSALAVMLEAQKQIMIDQTIGQFNLEMSKRYTQAEKSSVERAGSRAVRQGYSNAFTSILSGVSALK